MPTKHEKMSDVDKQILADGLKEISGLVRDRPEILGLMIGFASQAALSSVERENRKRGWKWSRTKLVWVTINGGHTIGEWKTLSAAYTQELTAWERDMQTYNAWMYDYLRWVKGEFTGPLPEQPPHPGGKPAAPFGATERPLDHNLVGKQGLQLLRNYGFASPLLHSVQSQWAEAGLMTLIGLEPWSDAMLDKASKGAKDLWEFYEYDDPADAAMALGVGPAGYVLWKWLFK